MIGQKARSLHYLFNESAYRNEEIISALRELMRKGIVSIDENDNFTLNK